MSALAACTASPLAGAEKTIRLIPAGLFRTTDGRPAGLPGWTLTASNAAAIIKAATSRADDFLIDYEHQTLHASKSGQPAPAAGWFKRLEWREGQGLFAVDVRWTARASSMIIAREYRYIRSAKPARCRDYQRPSIRRPDRYCSGQAASRRRYTTQ